MRRALSCSVVVPCRNEVDNVGDVVARLQSLGRHLELIFVDDGSTDGTGERLRQLMRDHPDRDIKLLRQEGPGCKADAVFRGFDAATGDVLMILDADMTVAPEDLARFLEPFEEGRAEFVTGTRFKYRMERRAMPLANKFGNAFFSIVMSLLLGTRITDTLCGTKCLLRRDWPRLSAARAEFEGHDRWGDFDLLLGAARCGLRIAEIPVRYRARQAGESKMRPIAHGLSLLRTCMAASRSSYRWRRAVRSA